MSCILIGIDNDGKQAHLETMLGLKQWERTYTEDYLQGKKKKKNSDLGFRLSRMPNLTAHLNFYCSKNTYFRSYCFPKFQCHLKTINNSFENKFIFTIKDTQRKEVVELAYFGHVNLVS